MNQVVAPFDDRLDPGLLLPEADRAALEADFRELTGRPVELRYERKNDADAEVTQDLETVAWVGCDDPGQAAVLAGIASRFCSARARYLMASRMHKRVVDLDYEELKRKNAELEKSREEYKQLSESLEERVNEQVERIETAQRQAYLRERLSTIGQLAAGMAHEINNPLGYIINNLKAGKGYLADIASGDLPDAEREEILTDFDSLLQESVEGAERVAVIVGDLKRFADIDNASPARTVNLSDLLGAAVRMVASMHPGAEQLCVLECPEKVDFGGHSGHLSQAFFNILDNAARACADAGGIRVVMEELPDGVHIEFRDDGCGMNAEQRERAFEPFFTTRKVGEGAGLGLTSARDIISAHQGTISIDSAKGKGTCVAVVLPGRNGAM